MTGAAMTQITRESLMTLEAYAKARPEFRKKVIAHKKRRTVPLGEHVTLLFEDERRTLCTGVDGVLSCQERHTFFRGGCATDDLLDHADVELVARIQNPGWIREVCICDVEVVFGELIAVQNMKRCETSFVHVVVGHRDGAEVYEEVELHCIGRFNRNTCR
jgi:hypothetical protein